MAEVKDGFEFTIWHDAGDKLDWPIPYMILRKHKTHEEFLLRLTSNSSSKSKFRSLTIKSVLNTSTRRTDPTNYRLYAKIDKPNIRKSETFNLVVYSSHGNTDRINVRVLEQDVMRHIIFKKIDDGMPVGDLESIELRFESGEESKVPWFCEYVDLVNETDNVFYMFVNTSIDPVSFGDGEFGWKLELINRFPEELNVDAVQIESKEDMEKQLKLFLQEQRKIFLTEASPNYQLMEDLDL
ncbi:hypothetical protein ACOME3_005474 [Neoechinorhynchus agilis]